METIYIFMQLTYPPPLPLYIEFYNICSFEFTYVSPYRVN